MAGVEEEFAPLKASEWFANEYPDLRLNDLDKTSVSLPEEIVSFGKGKEGFHLSQKEREDFKKHLKNEKDKNDFVQLGKHMDGAAVEISVFDILRKSLDAKGLLYSIFHSFKQMQTYRFLGIKEKNKTGAMENWRTEQEYDIILVLPKYKRFIVVEVKNSQEFAKSQLKSLIVGQQFFDNLRSEHLLSTEWEYIPVLALPNMKQRYNLDPRCPKPKNPVEFVLLTAQEMLTKNFVDILLMEKKIGGGAAFSHPDNYYSKLVKVLFASAHSHSAEKSASGLMLKAPNNPVDQSHKVLLGTNAPSVSGGFSEVTSDPPDDIATSQLKEVGVGQLNSFIFWNPREWSALNENHTRIVITGEYGTGKSKKE